MVGKYVLRTDVRKRVPFRIFVAFILLFLFLLKVKKSEIRRYAQPVPNSLSSLYMQIPLPSHSHLSQHTVRNPKTGRKLSVRIHRISTDSPPTFSKKVKFFLSDKKRTIAAETGGQK